jgi:hypothetical protein
VTPPVATITVSLTDTIGTHYQPSTDTDEPITLADALLDRLEHRIADDLAAWARSRLDTRLDDLIDTVAGDLIAATLDKPLRRTNSWGEPVGQETTVREHIQASITQWLTSRSVDYAGRGENNLDALIRRHVQAEMTGEMRAAITKGKNQILDTIRVQAAAVLTDALRKAIS